MKEEKTYDILLTELLNKYTNHMPGSSAEFQKIMTSKSKLKEKRKQIEDDIFKITSFNRELASFFALNYLLKALSYKVLACLNLIIGNIDLSAEYIKVSYIEYDHVYGSSQGSGWQLSHCSALATEIFILLGSVDEVRKYHNRYFYDSKSLDEAIAIAEKNAKKPLFSRKGSQVFAASPETPSKDNRNSSSRQTDMSRCCLTQ